MTTQKEMQTPLICRNEKEVKRKVNIQLQITYKSTTTILVIICSALITWILAETGWISWENNLQKIITIVAYIFYITISIYWICSKLVKISRKEKSLPQTSKSKGREEAHSKCYSALNIAQEKEKIKNV
ncbi:MAG: hypothetical protein ACLRZ9_05960 [Eubacterium sp.]